MCELAGGGSVGPKRAFVEGGYDDDVGEVAIGDGDVAVGGAEVEGVVGGVEYVVVGDPYGV